MASTLVATRAGHHPITPYLMATDAARIIDFLRDAFAGEEVRRELRSDGKVSHAEVLVSGATIMVGELGTDWEPLCAAVYLYVADLDEAHRRAVGAGALSSMEPTPLPDGDRMAALRDPFGNVWWLVAPTRPAVAGQH